MAGTCCVALRKPRDKAVRRPGAILRISCYELGHPEQVPGEEPLNRFRGAQGVGPDPGSFAEQAPLQGFL